MLSIEKYKSLIVLTLALIILTSYDLIFDLLLSMLHLLFVIAHYLFELCESSLDVVIEHLFHTSPRTTEIIVFYIMVGILSAMGLWILRALPGWYRRICKQLKSYFIRKKMQAMEFWREQTLLLKIKLCAQYTAATLTMLYFAII